MALITKRLPLKSKGEHKGPREQFGDGLGIIVVVFDPQINQAKCHPKLDGKFHITQKNVKTYPISIAQVHRVEANDGFVVVVLIFAQRGKVESPHTTGRKIGAEVAITLGSEF